MRAIVSISILSIAFVACGGDDVASTTVLPTPTTSVASSEATPSTVVSEAELTSAFLVALDATLEEPRYNFGGEFIVNQSGTPLPIRLNGWVDGPDRLVNAETEAGSIITKVSGGTATSIKNNVETEIPLEAAGSAPSLTILSSLDVVTETEGSVTGVLPASLLAEANGVSADGFVDATVWYTDRIVAYRLAARDGSWTLEMTFSPLKARRRSPVTDRK